MFLFKSFDKKKTQTLLKLSIERMNLLQNKKKVPLPNFSKLLHTGAARLWRSLNSRLHLSLLLDREGSKHVPCDRMLWHSHRALASELDPVHLTSWRFQAEIAGLKKTIKDIMVTANTLEVLPIPHLPASAFDIKSAGPSAPTVPVLRAPSRSMHGRPDRRASRRSRSKHSSKQNTYVPTPVLTSATRVAVQSSFRAAAAGAPRCAPLKENARVPR